MKKILFKTQHIPFVAIGVAALVFMVGLVAVQYQKTTPASASSGDIYLTSYEAQAVKDQTVSFAFRVNPGAKVDAITATLGFSTDDLQYKEASYENSPFTTQIPAIKTATSVTVQAARMGGETVNTDSPVAMVTFIAKKDGKHSVSITGGNAAYNGVATNPTLAGKVVERPQGVCSGNNCDANGSSSKSVSTTGTKGNFVATPVEEALISVGMSKATAQRSTPWVLGLIVCVVLALAFVAYLVIAKPRKLWPFTQKDINTQGATHDA